MPPPLPGGGYYFRYALPVFFSALSCDSNSRMRSSVAYVIVLRIAFSITR